MKEEKQADGEDRQEVHFEAALLQLEEVVKALEGGELPLDSAIDQFQRGMQLVRICREKLLKAEQKVELVMANEQGITSRPFQVEES